MSRGLNSYANKRDRNEPEIVKILRNMGLTVTTHDEPWDLCATFHDLSRWAEVKAPKNLKNEPMGFTDKQIERLKTWPGQKVDVLVTMQQARDFADRLKADARALRGRAA